MKNKILLLIALVGLLLPAGAYAQKVSMILDNREVIASRDTVASISSFTGKFSSGKTYLHWNVQDQQCDGLYIIYRSFDGKYYEVVGQKRGLGVPVSLPVAYYFQDEAPRGGITYYKVVHLTNNNRYMVSDRIAVTADETILSDAK